MRVRPATFSVVLVVSALPAAAQRLSDFITPRPVPPGGVLVVGFLGGFERWDDQHRGVRKVVLDLRSKGFYAETAGNHSRRAAVELIHRALDTNGDGRISSEEAAAARVILFGQSWGGAAVVNTARDLERWGVPVLLTVQVDSVGAHDSMIPANVRAAANFFQHDLFTIRGKTGIRAADPSRTRILGNFQFSYYFRHVDESDASWARRKLGGSHAKMELDPEVWQQVERLILQAVSE